MNRPLRYVFLGGLTRYADGLAMQRRVLDRRLQLLASGVGGGGEEDVVLFLQHAPVYTEGRRSAGVAVSPAKADAFARLGAEYVQTQRGGQVTFHGPGQLVAYPLLDLRAHKRSARCYVEALEAVMIRTCLQRGVVAQRTANTGVWVGETKKIGAIGKLLFLSNSKHQKPKWGELIGIQVSRYFTSHGLALNCDTDLRWYDHITACGLTGMGVTSLAAETASTASPASRDCSVDNVLPLMVRAFAEEFGREMVRTDASEHPLLRA